MARTLNRSRVLWVEAGGSRAAECLPLGWVDIRAPRLAALGKGEHQQSTRLRISLTHENVLISHQSWEHGSPKLQAAYLVSSVA